MAFIFGTFKRLIRSARNKPARMSEKKDGIENEVAEEESLGLKEARMGKDMHDAIMTDNVTDCVSILSRGLQINKYLKFVGRYSSDDRRTCISELQGSALHIACIYRRPKIVRHLLTHGASPNLLDKMGRSPLSLTITYWPRINQMVNSFHPGDQYGSYLYEICNRSTSILELLCENNANVNLTVGDNDESPLHLAAKFNLDSCIKLLLNYGGNVHQRDNTSKTPLIAAATFCNIVAINTLLSYDADPCDADQTGRTCLHYLCSHRVSSQRTTSLLTHLVSLGAEVNIQDKVGNSPLHVASSHGNEMAVVRLLQIGANADIVNLAGETPLYLLLNNINFFGWIIGLEKLLNSMLYIRPLGPGGEVPAAFKIPRMTGVRSELETIASTPPSLFRIAYHKLRKCLGSNINDHNVLKGLRLPPRMVEIIGEMDREFRIISFVGQFSLSRR